MRTALTKLLGIRVPVILPPMAGPAGGALAAAVSKAGGFGLIGAAHVPVKNLEAELAVARETLALPESAPLPIGVGLICWRLESPDGDPSQAAGFLEAILKAKVQAIWLSFSGSSLQPWVERVRDLEKKQSTPTRLKIFVSVWSVAAAKEAATWDVDIVVGQGTDSGGHGPTYDDGLPLLSLMGALQSTFAKPGAPLLVGAGGIVSGSQLVSVLPHASGAVMGTAFLSTKESLYSEAQKELIRQSTGNDTVRTMAFDYGRGSLGWGVGVDGRGVKNKTSEEKTEDVNSPEGRARYAEASKEGDVSRVVTWSGSSVGQVNTSASAGEVLKQIEEEAEAALDALAQLR